ncbi:DUF1127 domain-containing protein [Roseivivax sediminis]|uniref:YjiS-like domain-containing protein n=1 Tax=Roseivivax sediminis TaxID=936889 RepID=A0A1I1SIN1_9RHOB|nr:DUF1127 domain-containing protein [Roseivivax sediminis]SFD46291.1 protein of unknown function [Roseivivax sediminis]
MLRAFRLALPGPSGRGFLSRMRRIGAIRRERAALGRLDDAQLHDIGVTRAEATAEARRPAWDAPERWYR